MKRVNKLVCATGKYTDSNGNEKTSWQTIGYVLDDGGKKKIKLDSMPLSNEWDGWVTIAPLDEERKQQPQQQSKQPDVGW